MGLGVGGGVKLHSMGKASMPGSSSPCPSEEGLSTCEDLEEDESDSSWEENGPSLRWLRAETRTEKSGCNLGSIHPGEVIQIGFRGSGALIKKYLELGSCMWTFVFSGEERQSFHHLLQSIFDSPQVKSCPIREPLALPFSPSPGTPRILSPFLVGYFEVPVSRGRIL